MKKVIILLVLAIAMACHKDIEPQPSPTDASRIRGEWFAMNPTHPDWKYSFSDSLTQTITDFGVEIVRQKYEYRISADTVFISGHGGSRTWLLYFECDDIVRVTDEGAMLSERFWLKRGVK